MIYDLFKIFEKKLAAEKFSCYELETSTVLILKKDFMFLTLNVITDIKID